MKRLFPLVALAVLLPGSIAVAQIAPIGAAPGPSPLGITSPLGIGPATPVAPAGIPLGGTEISNLGISPATSGVSANGPVTSSVPFCAGFGSAIPQASLGSTFVGQTMAFDGGGITGNASGTCAPGGSVNVARPTNSTSSPTGMAPGASVGRVGIPLGATELGAGGLSPAPSTSIIDAPTTVTTN